MKVGEFYKTLIGEVVYLDNLSYENYRFKVILPGGYLGARGVGTIFYLPKSVFDSGQLTWTKL